MDSWKLFLISDSLLFWYQTLLVRPSCWKNGRQKYIIFLFQTLNNALLQCLLRTVFEASHSIQIHADSFIPIEINQGSPFLPWIYKAQQSETSHFSGVFFFYEQKDNFAPECNLSWGCILELKYLPPHVVSPIRQSMPWQEWNVALRKNFQKNRFPAWVYTMLGGV